MDIFEAIRERRSIRKFTEQKVSRDKIEKILEYGRWAPSGLNHQPWKVIVVENEDLQQKVAECTHYDEIILAAPGLFVILLDKTNTYSYVKNVQSIGAFFQNLLLGIHAEGLGGVWLGEIYNQKDDVHNILGIDDEKWEFMGAISFGHPNEEGESNRKSLDEIAEWF